MKANPYQLIWYKHDWTQTQTDANNAKYWEWEFQYNGFIPPNPRGNAIQARKQHKSK
jgi:hypothetical protein